KARSHLDRTAGVDDAEIDAALEEARAATEHPGSLTTQS
ncbi:hypothetical protein ACO22_04712, partial [Paracoccidioides brasiliensis]